MNCLQKKDKKSVLFIDCVIKNMKERRKQVYEVLQSEPYNYELYDVAKAYEKISDLLIKIRDVYTFQSVDVLQKYFENYANCYAVNSSRQCYKFRYNLEISTFFRYWSNHNA